MYCKCTGKGAIVSAVYASLVMYTVQANWDKFGSLGRSF